MLEKEKSLGREKRKGLSTLESTRPLPANEGSERNVLKNLEISSETVEDLIQAKRFLETG